MKREEKGMSGSTKLFETGNTCASCAHCSREGSGKGDGTCLEPSMSQGGKPMRVLLACNACQHFKQRTYRDDH